MRKQRTLTSLALSLAVLSAGGLSAAAQEGAQRKPGEARVEQRQEVRVIRQGPEAAGVVGLPRTQADTFVFVSSEMSFDGKVVKGAPYSAQAVTETTQVLADGNRIVRKNTADVYRDSEGRTRRDHKLGALGPFAVAGDPPQTSFINDPVAGVNYILDPRTRTARKMTFRFKFDYKQPGEGAEPGKPGAAVIAPAPSAGVAVIGPPPPGAPRPAGRAFTFSLPAPGPEGPDGPPDVLFYKNPSENSKTEKLEAQTVEGVHAEGTRTTFTIPAGEIGNERAIEVVSERWYSPELQTIVMMRHSDPRFGETVYRLTNINRSEPPRTLFEVPADYALKDGPAPFGPVRQRVRRPAPPGSENQ